ncbi:MAG: hypothetical protein KF850_22145 [Labilithrix sp.]|nr:hypothetical protein [Labilithrix sp.]
MAQRPLVVLLVSLSALACGTGAAPKAGSAPARSAATERDAVEAQADAPATATSDATASPAGSTTTPALTDEQILERVRADLAQCYEQGKKAAPKMANGKLTLLASVDSSGTTTCVVPMDDTGLTREVEDCMGARLARETYAAGPQWTFELPIAVRGGAITLGKETSGAVIDEVDAQGLPDANRVVQGLLPKLSECAQQMEASSTLRVIHVGARVGADGRVACALATGAGAIPEEVRTCSRGALESARFGAPKSGVGLVSIPVKILGKRPR